MLTPSPRRNLRQSAALIGGTALFAASLLAAAFAAPSSNTATPQQVAETLDSIVQPRFQTNAERFGIGRLPELEGHIGVDIVDADSRSERRKFAAVKASHRSYIIAFLHCRHKPGARIESPTKPEDLDLANPSTEALDAVGTTEKGADNMLEWADKSLDSVVLPHLKTLKQGHPAQAEYENWVIVMRPVRALHQSCITCHAGAKRGDTLGVMVYAVDKNRKIKGQSFYAPEGE